VLDKDICHVKVFSKLRVVQIAFGSFFGASPKEVPTCFVVFFPYQIFSISLFFLHNPHVGFWETLRPRFFQLPKGCFGVPINFFPHLVWGDRFHFHRGHCSGHLFRELGIHCTSHWH